MWSWTISHIFMLTLMSNSTMIQNDKSINKITDSLISLKTIIKQIRKINQNEELENEKIIDMARKVLKEME